MSPFDFINSISFTKADIMADDLAEKQYNAYLVNRGLSYFSDTVLLANEMNRNHHTPSRLQYSFLLNNISKKKRFSKWLKATEHEDLMIVKAYYGYSNEKARSALMILSQDQIQQLKTKLYQGGRGTKQKP